MNPKFIVELEKVCYSIHDHGQQTILLNDISFSLYAGEAVSIIGNSGSGKTTLLNLLAGLDLPASGQSFVNGSSWQSLSRKQYVQIRRSFFGFIYQHHHLIGELSALENIMLPAMISHCLSKKKSFDRALWLLDQLSILYCKDRFPSMLSGGERQRVAIARALFGKPACIIADEPTGNLDEKNAQKTIELLLQLQRQENSALVLVTHNTKQACLMEKTYHLQDGRLSFYV